MVKARLGSAAWSGLHDERSGRVVFVAHCLLNQNVRYLGGATRPGGIDEVIDSLQRQGVGICQMACPEQRVWGGVLKRHLLVAYNSDRTRLRRVRRVAARAFVWYTKCRYAWLARQIGHDIADYQRSGFAVVGLIGVDGSPSCGVTQTLAIDPALAAVAACDPASVDRVHFNERVIRANLVRGEGLFTASIRREMRRRGLRVGMVAHDLTAEVEGRPIRPIEFGDT
jgi:predicted secreted protein